MHEDLTSELLQRSLQQRAAGVVHDVEYHGLRAVGVIHPGVALDVGANRGQSIVSLKVLFPDLVVHAFEPNALFHDCLMRLAESFGASVHIHRHGLGADDGETRLYVPLAGEEPLLEEATTNPEHFAKPWIAERHSTAGELRIVESTVRIRAGDDLDLSPDVVKVDVEGAELDVLKGLRNTIVRSRPLLFVENNDWYGVTSFLSELGYEAFRWEPDSQRLVPYHGRTANCLYIHRSRRPVRERGVTSLGQGKPQPSATVDGGSAVDGATAVVDASADYDSPDGSAAVTRPRILVANFFPAFHPPRSGGEQRYHHFYRHLARHCDVTLLSPTHSNAAFEEVRFAPGFRELRVPKEPAFDRLHWDLDAQGIGPECSAYVVALASALETEYSRHFAAAVIDADAVIHESPFTLPYDRSFGIDGKPRIYNAYNVEHRLARQILAGEAGAKAADFIRFLERELAAHAELIFATSEEDRQQLAADFAIAAERIVLAPNGFEADEIEVEPGVQPATRDDSRVVFIGSAHPPNVEAARFIVGHLAPALPDVEFRLVGAVCDKLAAPVPGNVRLLGIVDEPSKRRELARCAVAINPMFAGSGTNLKALDYLANGVPVVTTPLGARGLGLGDGVDAFIAGGAQFARRLREALHERTTRERVGAAGRRRAYAEFTWQHIADAAFVSIEAMLAARRDAAANGRTRPLLLVVNDFPVAQGTGGGEARIRELSIELARGFDVVLLCLTDAPRRTQRRLAARVQEVAIPKTREHREAEVQAARGETISVGDLVAAEFCDRNAEFVAAFRQIASHASAVVFEHPYLAPLTGFLPARSRVVYSSLNVERRLKAELLRGRRDAASRIRQAEDVERRMLARADAVVCVSEEDRAELARDCPGRPCIVVENGVRTRGRGLAGARRAYAAAAPGDRMLGVFVGSAHSPNIDAARFLIETVAPTLPKLDVAIVGSVCAGVARSRIPANVHLLGILSEPEKNALLARADLALNPLASGGGSSLKVPDFFAAGLPLVSTHTGARGYRLRAGEHYLEADLERFVERTRELIEHPELRERIGRNARGYAEQTLDWSILGRRYRRALTELVGAALATRVLVVTYRLADPPPGGAEAFMVNLLRQFDAAGRLDVDVATCDIDTIADKWHFSAEYSQRSDAIAAMPYAPLVHRFAVDAPDDRTFARCARLFEVWMAETREQANALASGERASLLLGGWNYPERSGANVRRWSSREAHLCVGGAAAIRIRGRAPAATRAEIRRDGRTIASRAVDGRFEWSADLPAGASTLALCVDDTFRAGEDPRELGLLVEEIALSDGTQWRTLRLDEDFETAARRSDVGRWVRSLVDVTLRRQAADDELFFATRGPHSAALAQWLEANLASYDVVLAQGTPFSTPVALARIAARLGVPYVLLPHFHMEDRYYHWRHHYEAFRGARSVIVAPPSAKQQFFDAIGAPAVAVPGGGVDAGEFAPASLREGERAFEVLHRGTNPFVLVLGRKTGAKHYRMVVDAATEVNRHGHRVDVVLIGPDEDGVPVRQALARCYGAQGRSVVLGALARSLCLANMSESESFGIVLLESWLAGRPVIAQRRCTAFADLVRSGHDGVLVETVAELAAAIETYLEDEPLARQHAQNGREVAQRHTWAHIARGIETVLVGASRAASGRTPERDHG